MPSPSLPHPSRPPSRRVTRVPFLRRPRPAAALRGGAILSAALLAGCDYALLSPAGDIATQQRNLIIAATALMLIVIVPVIALTFLFAWRYRASAKDATYDPSWHHSTPVEVAIWTVPLLIIMALGAMTWISTHILDPFRPLARIGPGEPVPADVRPLEVEVVALDWKWLFIYPEYGIAAVNEMAAPTDRPVRFRITSASVWNTLSIPAVAGMIYAMPGMETQLNAVINEEGTFMGLSGHYSGSGFSRMTFAAHGLADADFDAWVAKARETPDPLDRAAYLELDRPSEAVPVRYYGGVEAGLFDAVVGLCVEPGTMCVHEMHGIDAAGGAAADSEANRARLEYDRVRDEGGHDASGATFPATGEPSHSPEGPEGTRGDSDATAPGPEQGEAGDAAPAQLNTAPAHGAH